MADTHFISDHVRTLRLTMILIQTERLTEADIFYSRLGRILFQIERLTLILFWTERLV